MDRNTACELQLTGAHVGDRVTMLTAGETDLVQCLCYVSNVNAPELRSTNDSLSDDEIVYLRALQQLLTSMGRRPDTAPRTDVYTSQTIEEVKRFQQSAEHLPSGIVDAQTWKLLKGRGCENAG
jgi:murein L,D-transpeptidase YcbB/YkuD